MQLIGYNCYPWYVRFSNWRNDYTDGSGTIDDITISAGSTTGTVNFTPTDDTIYDATSNETATIAINSVSGKSGVNENGDQSVTITITDNESAPTVTLTVSATSIAENAGTSLTLTATLSNGTYQDVTVALSTSGTATEGTDYTDGSGAIDDMTISAGSTTTTLISHQLMIQLMKEMKQQQ